MSVVFTAEVVLIAHKSPFSASHDEKKMLGMAVDGPLQGIYSDRIHKFIRGGGERLSII